MLISLLVFFLSCSTVSPVVSAQEYPVIFPVVENVIPVWQPFADGIGYFHGKITNPQLEYWALRIDLDAPDTRIVVSGSASNGDTLSTKVSSFVRSNNLAAGINTVPFDVISTREGQPINSIGLVISDGRLISPANPRYDALVFSRDTDGRNRAAIVSQSSINSYENIENAAGGFHRVLTGGEIADRLLSLEELPRHPRSAAGVSANGDILFLLVIDGRRAGSEGATETEIALLLRSLGSWDGLNFDGGGSSALALRYPDGAVRTVNTPIHGGIPGLERAVAGILGVSDKN